MHLKKLSLINFRNYIKEEVSFDPHLNIFLGDNGQGKTNLLEAIYFLSGGKSNRTRQDKELINWEKDLFTLRGIYESKKGSGSINILNPRGDRKRYKLNGIEKRENSGEIKAVLFSPDDLNLIKGSPSLRRNFLDREGSQIFPLYSYNLKKYNKVLRQRNKLLKLNMIGDKYLEPWDRQLIEYGSFIVKKRLEIINKMSMLSRLIYRRLTQGRENFQISYFSEMGFQGEDSLEKIRDILENSLHKKREEEIRYGATLLGPHRDDLHVFVEGQEARLYGSQGQQRTGILSLKMAILEIIKGYWGEYPLLLLDDVFSELDEERRDYLVKEIKNGMQTFITSTREKNISPGLEKWATKFLIHKGECHPLPHGKNIRFSG
ncbi:MAG: DNA replication/repair protein RecF [Candidatus Syntrophonatronum acetioxidans]|uniref:DNA replication and repair protein RecF n=1 Tax=Candidatus Syntrophonatronum acetioxidans TaxID=1795816 RepID=A0A424YBG6_9FIRM|nr:MAG: DNA replication/repair protein RecF [Candidatus Syntrophonatronum acetioxidans]